MKQILTSIILFAVAIAAMAQNKAEIIVSYDSSFPNKFGKINTGKMSLLASTTEAKYFNNLSLWVDSLESTPEGKAQYMEIIQKACMTIEPDGSVSFDMRKGPTKPTNSYVFTDLAKDCLTHYNRFGENYGYYTLNHFPKCNGLL